MYGLHFSSITSPLLKKKMCQTHGGCQCWDMFCQHERREEIEREREYIGANEQMSRPLPPCSWAIFIGEVERVVYILFNWWGEILQVGPQIFITRSLEAVIKSLYL
jgi:hypothetical protein